MTGSSEDLRAVVEGEGFEAESDYAIGSLLYLGGRHFGHFGLGGDIVTSLASLALVLALVLLLLLLLLLGSGGGGIGCSGPLLMLGVSVVLRRLKKS